MSVRAWRLGILLVLLLFVVAPLAMPVAALVRYPESFRVLLDAPRLWILTHNTLLLILGTLTIALPPGVVLAVLLYRTDLPARRWLRGLILVTLFIPLPLFASGWQAALGSGGWLTFPSWTTVEPSDPDLQQTGIPWKPWAHGLVAASWIHALAGLPWIVLLVGQGLCWVERELEEDALMVVDPWKVLLYVTLPRARASLGMAVAWVAIMTATEIAVADMMQVRTFAEEVYNQFTRPEVSQDFRLGLAGTIAANLPAIIVCWILLWLATRRFERSLPPLDRLASLSPLVFPLGCWRWPLLLLTCVGCGLLVGVPVGSLLWKAGTPSEQTWSASITIYHLQTTLSIRWHLIVGSILWALTAGMLIGDVALIACWVANGNSGVRRFVLMLAVTAWVIPGPIIGIGLKETINVILNTTHSQTLADALYYGPSPLPLLWAYSLRFLPAALALLWPIVRLIPRELIESAQIDGATPTQELTRVIWPLTRLPWLRAGLAVAVLAMGELSASKLVETPGSQTFAHEVFTQMHFGVTEDLAALCLWLLIAVIAGALGVMILIWFSRNPMASAARARWPKARG
jgi:iron(III) transport system permease protein